MRCENKQISKYELEEEKIFKNDNTDEVLKSFKRKQLNDTSSSEVGI